MGTNKLSTDGSTPSKMTVNAETPEAAVPAKRVRVRQVPAAVAAELTTKSLSEPKLAIIRSNGSILRVRAVSPVIVQLRAKEMGHGPPLPLLDKVMDIELAKTYVEELKQSGYYVVDQQ